MEYWVQKIPAEMRRRLMFKYGLKHSVASNFPFSDRLIARRVKREIVLGEFDSLIADKLNSPEPIAIGRLGGTEARYLGDLVKLFSNHRNLGKFHMAFASRDLQKRRVEVNSNAGFFSSNFGEEIKFMEFYISALENLDVLGVWGEAFAWVESIGISTGNLDVVPLAVLSPWLDPFPYESDSSGAQPWVKALDGKKILVVSPFSRTIESQHEITSKAFQQRDYPNFELQTLRAPMTFGEFSSPTNNWFNNLERLMSASHTLDFDVALVGAGAYSLPLVNAIKQQGKKAVHCGGGLQLFFAVMGNRWMNSPFVLKYFNEYWARPSLEEVHLKASSVENSCYW